MSRGVEFLKVHHKLERFFVLNYASSGLSPMMFASQTPGSESTAEFIDKLSFCGNASSVSLLLHFLPSENALYKRFFSIKQDPYKQIVPVCVDLVCYFL